MNKIFEKFKYMGESQKIKIANNHSDYSYPYLCRGNGIFGSKYLFGIDIYNKYYTHVGDIRINTNGELFRFGDCSSLTLTDEQLTALFELYAVKMLLLAYGVSSRFMFQPESWNKGYIFDTYNADDKLAIFDSSDNLIDCNHYKVIYNQYIK